MALTTLNSVQFADQYLVGANDINLVIPKVQLSDGNVNAVNTRSLGPWQLDSVFYNRVNTNAITIQILVEYQAKVFKLREVLNFVANNWFFQINQEFPPGFSVRIKTIGAQINEDHAVVAIYK